MMKTLKKLSLIIALCFAFVSTALAAYPVNINQANAAQIAEALEGVGLSKAQRIVDYRKAHGNFTDVKQLLQVKGIGEKTLQKNDKFIQLK